MEPGSQIQRSNEIRPWASPGHGGSLDPRCNPVQGLTRDGLEHALEYLYCAKLQPKSLDDFGEALLAPWISEVSVYLALSC